MMTTQQLDAYVGLYTVFNEVPPQLKTFINGLKALNEGARIKTFTFDGKFYTIMVPQVHFKGVNIRTYTRKFIANALVKKDITQVSVAGFNSILEQVFETYTLAYCATYYFLRDGYNDKCRHTKTKYYSLNNPKK